MQESVLSSRRLPPSPDAEDQKAAAGSVDGGGDDDESKTRKHTPFSARISNFVHPRSPSSTHGRCLAASSLLLALFLLASALVSRSRSIICVSPYDSLARRSFPAVAPLDGLASDFGSLGVPWCRSKYGKTVEWTTKDLLKGLEEFVPIYETRPIKNNMYGMGFDHSFGLWFMARWIKPDLMIESGAFKGHSTWVLRQARPETPIVSISPRHPQKYLAKGAAYVDRNCTYFAGKDFVDFGSVGWGSVLKKHGVSDFDRVLVFFDDHQSELKRLRHALKAGFRHLIFEDNYDTGTGDHYSLRQICDQFYIREHFENSRFVESVLDVYWELPPVAGPSLTHQTRYDPARASDPIIEDGRFGLFQRLGLGRLETSVFNGYTQMVYLQISASTA